MSGSTPDVGNYQPINISPVVLRVVGKIIDENVRNYLPSCDLTIHHQHGFPQSWLCMTCHMGFFSFIDTCCGKSHIVRVLHFNISKAFYPSDHLPSLRKLKAFYTGLLLLDWIKFISSNGKRMIIFDSVHSQPKHMISRVIKCDTVGPLTFIFHINATDDPCSIWS